jgi:spermidine synthase
MREPAARRPAAGSFRILLALFFVSGTTSLAYQLLWVRELQLVFGTSTYAVSTLLAAFMGGLAAGGFAMARHADRLRRPLAVYGVLELGIGLYALVFPFLLVAVTPVYLAVWRATEPGPAVFGFVQFVLTGALLLLPTSAMGATLPLLARFATQRFGSAGRRIGSLYAANTFGAVAGVWICGFLLLPHLGMLRTTLLAVAANLLLGAAAISLDRRAPEHARRLADDPGGREPRLPVMVSVCTAIGLAGFSALAYEVAWTRLLALILGSSTYTFAVMLIAFLLGIAWGGKLGGPLADRVSSTGGRRRLLYAFALVETAAATLSCATMYLYPELPFWYVHLFDELGAGQRPEALWWVSLLLAGLVMTPPAVLMGLHFPIAARAVVGYGQGLGRPVGIVYGINALGGAAGAFLAGFVMLPVLGVQGTVFVAAAGGLLAAGVLILQAGRSFHGRRAAVLRTAAAMTLAGLALLFFTRRPPWDPLLMTAGLYQYAANFQDHSREGILRYSVAPYDLVFYEEGLSSVVTVARYKGSAHRWLAVNGKVDASTTDDMPTQVLLSLLPMQFVPRPEDVLVIGLASGVTAGSASLLPEVERLRIVELEPAMERAARFFAAWNHSVLSDPRVDLVYNDARNHLLLAEPGSYDVVISEPSNPWISGVANLFTREFLEIGKSRLKPGGAWSQWVPIYGMDSRDLRVVLKTFAEVFPYVAVYSTIDYNDLVLIGSESPLRPTERAAMRLLSQPAVAAELSRAGVDSPIDLISLYLMDRAAIAEMTKDVCGNTDDNMLIEYSTAAKLHVETRPANFALLLRHARLPESPLGGAGQWRRLAHSYRQRGDAARGAAAASVATRLASGEQMRDESGPVPRSGPATGPDQKISDP